MDIVERLRAARVLVHSLADQWRERAERAEAKVAELERDLEAMRETWSESNRCYFEQFNRAGALQAQIDRLMLEFCPDEMTPEQLENWGNAQKAVDDDGLQNSAESAPIDAARAK